MQKRNERDVSPSITTYIFIATTIYLILQEMVCEVLSESDVTFALPRSSGSFREQNEVFGIKGGIWMVKQYCFHKKDKSRIITLLRVLLEGLLPNVVKTEAIDSRKFLCGFIEDKKRSPVAESSMESPICDVWISYI